MVTNYQALELIFFSSLSRSTAIVPEKNYIFKEQGIYEYPAMYAELFHLPGF